VSHVALRFDVIADDADAWSDALLDAGASSVDASDPLAGTSDEVPVFAEPGVEATGWLTVRLCALFPEHTDAQTLMAEVADTIDRAAPPFESFDVMDRDWVRATQAQFAPIRIADDFWIVPTWTAAPVDSGRNIALDPGVAFGTGSHPTTHLCLEWLRQGVRGGESVLDYGCGSGILAIAAMKLGARRAVGTDIDPQALAASAANAHANSVTATFIPPDEIGADRFDIVVANILANPLIVLAPVLATRVRDGGRIALSGVLEPQAADVVGAYARWFDFEAPGHLDGWTLLAGVRTR